MCAIFGLIDYNHTLNAKQREKLLRVLSQECEERGTDATGYAFNHNGKLTIYKRPYAAHKVHLRLHDDSNVIMGHTRMSTQGNKLDNRNNHPFPGTVNETHFALAHNGVLHNDVRLRKQMSLPNTPVKTDSYIAVQLLEQQKSLDIQSTSFVMVQSQWVISLDKVEVAFIIKHGKYKRTLDKFSHFRNGLYVEGFLLFQELNCYIAVRLDWRVRE